MTANWSRIARCVWTTCTFWVMISMRGSPGIAPSAALGNCFPSRYLKKHLPRFNLCVEKEMVSGHTQAIDSMDTLELKVPKEELAAHLNKESSLSAMNKAKPYRKSKKDKSDDHWRKTTASPQEPQGVKGRNKKWSNDQGQRPRADNKGSKYTSNKRHYSPTGPDARISVKPGKARKLNYTCQLTVRTTNSYRIL